MKTFRDLWAEGESDVIAHLLANIRGAASGAWRVANDVEQDLKSSGFTVVELDDSRHGLSAQVWLLLDSPERLKVTNILPRTQPSLDYDEYNAILTRFEREVLAPAAQSTGVKLVSTGERIEISDYISASALLKLRAFSKLANRSSYNPLDGERWYAFVIQTHREGARVSAALLLRWLIEDEHWPEQTASSLVAEYETIRGVLSQYDHEKVSA